MARVAFYAPLKPPGHAVPSGDREMARNLMRVIGAQARVEVVSTLQVRDRSGDAGFQAERLQAASDEVRRLIAVLGRDGTDLWVTYHNYYKAPDLIGPQVCRALNLPYVQIESTRARSRLNGPWAGFAQAAEDASDHAGIIFYLTDLDRATLERDRTKGQQLVHLRPFLARDTLPEAADPQADRLLSVGMMRAGDKMASYQIIADTLEYLKGDWRLDIAGDGPARGKVEALMGRFGNRVRFLGQLDSAGMAQAYQRAGLFFWPGVNEAYGMVYLEAQSAGVPVVAQDRPGVRDVVLSGALTPVDSGPRALADRLDGLLNDADERRLLGQTARRAIARNHLFPAACETFWNAVTPLIETRK